MDEREIRRLLEDEPVPGAAGAESRARRMVLAARDHEPRAARPRSRRGIVRIGQVAIAIAILGALISPAGASVRRWVGDAIAPGREPSRPVLTSLPTSGEVLVQSRHGTWIVREDGSKRRLGDYLDSTFSPRAMYVAAGAGRQLFALDPRGGIRWSVARSGPIRSPAWSTPDGYRIAYVSGSRLRVIAGDGTGDHLLRRGVRRAVRPAWRPGDRNQLAYASGDGRVGLVDADTGRTVFETPPLEPTQLAWTGDGSRLLVAGEGRVLAYAADGRRVGAHPTPGRVAAIAVSPGGRVAAISRSRRIDRSRLLLLSKSGGWGTVFSGPGRFTDLAFSPDGAYILLAWKSADQWLFLRPGSPRRTEAISNISSQFGPGRDHPGFPTVTGWCCRVAR